MRILMHFDDRRDTREVEDRVLKFHGLDFGDVNERPLGSDTNLPSGSSIVRSDCQQRLISKSALSPPGGHSLTPAAICILGRDALVPLNARGQMVHHGAIGLDFLAVDLPGKVSERRLENNRSASVQAFG